MTKKVTISVSDDLHERMEKWRNDFNFSRIFQDAVSQAMDRREAFRERIKEVASMGQVIERLKQEKAESQQADFETGKTDGLEWAKAAHYDEIRLVVNVIRDAKINRCRPDIPVDLVRGDVGYSEHYFEDKLLELAQDGVVNLEKWREGWLEGVKEFWDEVVAKL